MGTSNTTILAANNTYSGGTTISNGTIQLDASGTLGSGNVNIYNTGKLTINHTNSFSINNTIVASSVMANRLTHNGSGTTTLGGSADNFDLVATINAGILALGKASSSTVHALGGGTNIVNATGMLQLAGSGGDQIWDSTDITLNSGGALDLNGRSESIDGIIFNGTGINGTGALTNSSASAATLTIASASPLASTSSIGGIGDITIAGPVSSLSAQILMKVGNNTLTLASGGDNAFLFLQVYAGTAVLAKPSTSAIHAVGELIVNSGSTVQLSGSGSYEIWPGAIPTINSGGVLDLNGHIQIFTSVGPTISGTGISGGGALINSSNVAATLTGPVILGADAAMGGSGNFTISGIISGTGAALIKSGSGTLTLQGANSYTGNTLINAGTLALGTGGSLNSGSSISIAAGATFDVSGLGASATYTLGGSVLTASGTTSAATITGGTSGTVDLGAKSITLNYNGSNPALTISQGTLSLNGGNAFTVNGSVLAPGAYTIVSQTSGNVISFGSYPPVTGTAIGSGKAGVISISGGNVILTIKTVIALTGTRTYDGTTNVTAASLSVANNIDGANLTLAGTATLAAKDVGSQAISITQTTPVRVQSASTNNGTAAITLAMTVAAPANGNTLIAVISTTAAVVNQITNISQSGATWTRAAHAANSAGVTTTIWYAPGVSGAGTNITIQLARSLKVAAVVMEYSGVLTTSPVDQAVGATGTSATADTGTTLTTTQANEVWIGGIGISGDATLMTTTNNSFNVVATTASTGAAASSRNRVYALEKIVATTGTANSGGTLSASSAWSGAMATFKPVLSLTLGGAAAGNYTLAGASGSVTVTAKALTVTGLTASARVYDGTTTEPLGGTAALQTAEAPGTGTTSDGKAYTGDTVSLGGTAAGAFADKHVGTAKAVTVTGNTLSGAQSGNYTLTQQTGLTANITARPLTVTAATNTKAYDGTTSAAGTPTVTVGAVQTGDTANFTEVYSTVALGSGKTLIPSGTVTDGNSGANYTYTFANNTTGVINPASVSITSGITANNKVYDGLNTATISSNTVLLAGVVSGETANVKLSTNGYTSTFASANAGTGLAVTVSGFTLTGTAAGNYALTQPTLSANITARAATLTGARAYDGTTNAAAAVLTISNKVGSDAVTVASGTGGLAGKDVGTRAITSFGSLALGGTLSANYTLTGASGSVMITQAVTTVTLSSSGNPSGFHDNVTFTATLQTDASGTVVLKTNSVTLNTPSLSGGSAASATTALPRGTNTITAEYGGDSNYLGSTNSITQTVTNHLPVSAVMTVLRTTGLSLKIALADVVTNWSDVDGDAMTLAGINLATTNSVNLSTNSTWIFYTNSPNVNDRLTFNISDGHAGTNIGVINIVMLTNVTGQMQSLTVSGTNATLSFAGIPSYSYSVQRTTNLVSWATLWTTNAPSAGLFQYLDNFSDLDGMPASAYYRLKWNP